MNKVINLATIIILATAITAGMFQGLTLMFGGESSRELDEYVLLFKEEMFRRGVEVDTSNVDIRFKNYLPMDGAVGVAYPPVGTKRIVEILKNYYIKAPPEVKESLIAHELGHVYGLQHKDDIIFVDIINCPSSVMHSEHNMAGCFNTFRQYYYDELAFRIKKALDKGMEL